MADPTPAPRSGSRAPRPLEGLRVCRFGHFSPRYARNRIVVKALRLAGAHVQDVVDHRAFPVRTPSMVARSLRRRFDLLLVPYPGHSDVPAARMMAGLSGTPLLFDAFLSLHETYVEDRARIRAGSVRARWPALVDRTAAGLADLVLLDTQAHIEYFERELGARGASFRRVWVGADDEIVRPGPRTGDPAFAVFLYASFVPLHGVDMVVRAAHILEARGSGVRFRVAGTGMVFPAVRRLAEDLGIRSVDFLGRRPYRDLVPLMAESDVCLGIFGTTPKAGRVVPNKVFDGLAARRAVITADTPAAREAVEHGNHAWLIPSGDPEALAESIARLKDDPGLRDRLAGEGHARFREAFSIEAISRDLASAVGELMRR